MGELSLAVQALFCSSENEKRQLFDLLIERRWGRTAISESKTEEANSEIEQVDMDIEEATIQRSQARLLARIMPPMPMVVLSTLRSTD